MKLSGVWDIISYRGGRRAVVRLAFFVMLAGLGRPLGAAEELKLKILAVNPSATNKISTDVKNALPPEITAVDVLDAGGLEVKYDTETKSYYVSGKVDLAPRESKTIVVTIRDVWKIPAEKIESARAEINRRHASLKGTKFEATGELLFSRAAESIDQIEASQNQAAGIRKRIELYRANSKRLEDLQQDILSIGALQKMDLVKDGETRTAKFQIDAENPSAEVRTMTIRADLPREIKSEDVLDARGFSILFDDTKSRYALEKQDEFKASEKKSYQITLRDIWFIQPKELEYLSKQTDSLEKHFAKSKYAEFAQGTALSIRTYLAEIETLQEEVADSPSIQDRIRAFTLNSQKLNLVKAKLKELQDLLLELPLEVNEENSPIKKMVQGIKEIQKVPVVAKILTMGIDPNVATTWWVILGIVAFLMILATIFYVTWLGKLKKNTYEKPPESGAGGNKP